MSADADENGEEIPGREIAYRLFAAEYDDASLSYAESDEERAPNYVITPTGARLNRVFVAGTLTEVTSVNDEMVRARVVDPTGAFVVYAGQYQPDELATLESIEPPAFVAVTGKARTFQPEDADRVYTSLRPESIATIDADTRDRWVVSAAEQTLERIGAYAATAGLEASAEPRSADALTDALTEDGVESGLANGIPLAMDHYGTTPDYLAALRDCALEACEVVAGERDQVSGLALAPDESSPAFETSFEALAELGETDLEHEADGVESDSQPDPAAVTAGEDEPEPVSAATADEFSAADDVPTDTAGDDPAFDAAEDSEEETTLESEPDIDVADSEPDEGAETAPSSSEEPGKTVEATTDDTGTDELGDFDVDDEVGGDTVSDDTEPESGELGDFDAGDGGMYEMDDEEREQLEEEFGAEFATGTEVDDPGENDLDVPEPDTDDLDEASGSSVGAGADADPDAGADPTSTSPEDAAVNDDPEEAGDEADADDAGDEPASVDLEAAVVETMAELDDGDGADRSTVVETVASETGVDEGAVEDAIEEALMGGQCYEPADGTLKAI